MQAKYLAALKTRYASFGLSKEALDRVASQRFKTIANEDEIDEDVKSDATSLLVMKEIQGSADAQRSRVAQLQKELEELKRNQPNNQDTQEPDDELSKKLQTLTELVTTMQTERAAEKKKAQSEAVIAQVHEIMKKNGCSNDFIRKATLSGVEIGENDTAESLAEKYKSIYDSNCKETFGDGYVPRRSDGNVKGEIDFSAMVAGLQASGDLPK